MKKLVVFLVRPALTTLCVMVLPTPLFLLKGITDVMHSFLTFILPKMGCLRGCFD